jgi:Cu2+-exporting ATPase
MGSDTVMLTGDNELTAQAIASGLGITHVVSGVLPDGKVGEVRRLKQNGKVVVMLGDGINDAPALTRADVGIAIGAGSDIALDAADIVLVKSDLADVPAAVNLSRHVIRNIHQNLFWAFFYNAVCIPLAAGCYVGLGLTLNPMYGAAAMSLSSVTVCLNALRLNLLNIRSSTHDRPLKKRRKKTKAGTPGEITLSVGGMMCPHCEATVKKALESLSFVEEAEADHESGTVRVVLSAKPDEQALRAAVEAEEYEYNGMI